MVRLISRVLSVLVLRATASGLPLKPQWAATISGDNGGAIGGTFRWDAGPGTVPEFNSTRYPKMEAHWNFTDSWFAAQGLGDSMGFACTYSDEHSCTSLFRKRCFRGLDSTRTESLVRLLIKLHERGELQGDCSAYSSYLNATGAQLWSVGQEGIGKIEMCISPDGLPLGLASFPDKSFCGPSNVGVATFRFLFHNVTLGPQSIKEASCQDCGPVAPCKGEGVVSMEVMRLTNGGGEPWDQLWNLDVADLTGEFMFDHGFSRSYLKVFNVTVNSSWGPSRDCNFVGGENHISPAQAPGVAKSVARRDAEGFYTPCGGQCSANGFGSYYAFPKEGGCPKGLPVGTDGCTWQVNSVKVVATDCVKAAGQLAASLHEDFGHPPWSAMQASIRKGVGQCPDIRSLRR